jgi:hypothetical protein
VPDAGVVFEEVLEALGEAQLAASVELGGADRGDQRGHRLVFLAKGGRFFTALVPWIFAIIRDDLSLRA